MMKGAERRGALYLFVKLYEEKKIGRVMY